MLQHVDTDVFLPNGLKAFLAYDSRLVAAGFTFLVLSNSHCKIIGPHLLVYVAAHHLSGCEVFILQVLVKLRPPIIYLGYRDRKIERRRDRERAIKHWEDQERERERER